MGHGSADPAVVKLRWCEAGFDLMADGGALHPRVDILRSLRATGGGRHGFEVDTAPGLQVLYSPEPAEHVALRYSGGGDGRSLVVHAGGDEPTALAQARLSAVAPRSVMVGDRPAFVTGPDPVGSSLVGSSLLVQYDDHTLVTVTGVGLTEQEVVDAAASLAPADPALTPIVEIGKASCDNLHLCN